MEYTPYGVDECISGGCETTTIVIARWSYQDVGYPHCPECHAALVDAFGEPAEQEIRQVVA